MWLLIYKTIQIPLVEKVSFNKEIIYLTCSTLSFSTAATRWLCVQRRAGLLSGQIEDKNCLKDTRDTREFAICAGAFYFFPLNREMLSARSHYNIQPAEINGHLKQLEN